VHAQPAGRPLLERQIESRRRCLARIVGARAIAQLNRQQVAVQRQADVNVMAIAIAHVLVAVTDDVDDHLVEHELNIRDVVFGKLVGASETGRDVSETRNLAALVDDLNGKSWDTASLP
jgi:hypothetical protein